MGFLKQIHRWIGVLIGVVVILLALTGLALHHYPKLKQFLLGVQDRKSSTPFDQPIHALGYAPWSYKTVWVANAQGVFVSQDNAVTFSKADLPKKRHDVVGIFFDLPGMVSIWFRSGEVWISTDKGRHFIRESLPEGVTNTYCVTRKGDLWVFSSNRGLFRGNFVRGFRVMAQAPSEDLYQFILNLHSGYFWPTVWPYVTDVAAVGVIILTLTGFRMFFKLSGAGKRRRG